MEFFTEDNEEYDYEILVEDGVILSASYEWENAGRSGKEITLEEAREAAVEDAGVKPDEVTFTKEKTEKDDGIRKHEVEFYTEDQKEYEYEFNADTGVMISRDYDGERYLRQQKKN